MTKNEFADMVQEANEKKKKTSPSWTSEKYEFTKRIIDEIRRSK